MLTFPKDLVPNFVTGYEAPDYPVHTFTSDSGVEWRNIQSCAPSGAMITLSWDKTTAKNDVCSTGCFPMPQGAQTDPVVCAIWNWWKTCRGTFRAFEIERDHPLWGNMEGIDECFNDLIEPFNRWRFDKKPKTNTDQCGIYDVSITLIQIPQCNTYAS